MVFGPIEKKPGFAISKARLFMLLFISSPPKINKGVIKNQFSVINISANDNLF